MRHSFKAVLFECCQGNDIHPVQLLKDLSEERSVKLLLYNTGLTKEKASLYSVVFDVVITKETAMKYEQTSVENDQPSPKVITRCLGDLDISPSDTLALCTSPSGCVAANEANLGVVVCTDPSSAGKSELYKSLGCDSVIPSDNFNLIQASDLFRYHSQNVSSSWNLTYHSFNEESELGRESLTTVANGRVGLRGSLDFCLNTPGKHYPGCYISGVYNLSDSVVGGTVVQNSDLVNCPNFNKLTLLIDGEIIIPTQYLVSYEHALHMKTATMSRNMTICDKKGRLTRIELERFASMRDPLICGNRIEITPLNHDAEIKLKSDIDCDVENDGVPRYSMLNKKHLKTLKKKSLNSTMGTASVKTTGLLSSTFVSMVSRHVVVSDCIASAINDDGQFEVTFKENKLILEKITSISISKNNFLESETAAVNLITSKGSYDSLRQLHISEWFRKWNLSDIIIKGDRNMRLCQRTARLNLYHSMSSYSEHCIASDCGLPARGLTGEGSRGHIFWDELFWFPPTLLYSPKSARAHLQYRINKLPRAMQHATQNGFRGAMIPWQSSDTGAEVTQQVHYNPISKTWDLDKSNRQRHVGLAVFINSFRYYRHTLDHDFLINGGLGELMIEICRFFSSCATLDNEIYHIRNVMGPDEYHEEANVSDKGVDDNAYTNVVTSFMLHTMLDIIDRNVVLKSKYHISENELILWRNISSKLKICFIDEGRGALEQFDGWSQLRDFNFSEYKNKYTNEQLQRLDRVLKAEGKKPDDYKIVKQPDTLMIFYVLSPEEIELTFRRLGYGHTLLCLDPTTALRINYDYYSPKTTSGSALTYTVHTKLANKLKRQSAQAKWFKQSISGDLFSQRSADGTVNEGVHVGVMSGTIDFLITDIVGMSISDDLVSFLPDLPPGCDTVQFKRLVKGNIINVLVSRSTVSILLEAHQTNNQLFASVRNTLIQLKPWSNVTVQYALSTHSEFHLLMRRSRVIRSEIVQSIFDHKHVNNNQIESLKEMRDFLSTVPTLDNKSILYVDDMVWGSYATDLSVEVEELVRDIMFLENEKLFLNKLRSEHSNWDQIVSRGRKWIQSLPDNLTFIFSRDNATMRNTKFLSSIQPIYNSVYLTRFAKSKCYSSTYITTSPLGGEASARKIPVEANGVFDVCVNPLNTFNYSGSSGRVFVSASELTGKFPFPYEEGPSEKQLDEFNIRVVDLLRSNKYKKFLSFGKGFQQKWGETIITLEDPFIEIPKPEKKRLREAVQEIITEVDKQKILILEETSSELRIADSRVSENHKNFTKADGVRFLDRSLGLDLHVNPSLVVCGSPADLLMVNSVPNPSVIMVGMPQVSSPIGVTNVLRIPTTDHLLGILNASSDSNRWPVRVSSSQL